jgi:hypothetical protein
MRGRDAGERAGKTQEAVQRKAVCWIVFIQTAVQIQSIDGRRTVNNIVLIPKSARVSSGARWV